MTFDRVTQLDETAEKRARLHKIMKERGWGAVVFSKRHNFAWASGGSDNHVRHASELGVEESVELAVALSSPYRNNPAHPPDELTQKKKALFLERLRKEGAFSPEDRP